MGRTYTYDRSSRLGRAHNSLAYNAYALGLSSGSVHGGIAGKRTVRVFWRGKRMYFLRWPRWKWRCLLKFHHWPTDYTVVFDLCGKCCPHPCCGAITVEHADDCEDR